MSICKALERIYYTLKAKAKPWVESDNTCHLSNPKGIDNLCIDLKPQKASTDLLNTSVILGLYSGCFIIKSKLTATVH